MSWLDRLFGTDPESEARRRKASFEAEAIQRVMVIPLERWKRADRQSTFGYVAVADGGAQVELCWRTTVDSSRHSLLVDGEEVAHYSYRSHEHTGPSESGNRALEDLYRRLLQRDAPDWRQRSEQERRQSELDAEAHRRSLLRRL